jgi:hypothetical protein
MVDPPFGRGCPYATVVTIQSARVNDRRRIGPPVAGDGDLDGHRQIQPLAEG